MILLPPTEWWCPNCSMQTQTPGGSPARPFHPCPGLRGLQAPMVPAGQKARVTARDREDYVGTEKVQTDEDGRPVMSIVTERPDGSNDAVVLAPTASFGIAAHK